MYATKDYCITYLRGSSGSPHLAAYVHARKHEVAFEDLFKDNDSTIGTYCDADLAGDEDTRKSMSGLAIAMHGGVVSWMS